MTADAAMQGSSPIPSHKSEDIGALADDTTGQVKVPTNLFSSLGL
jgi:hypothetical protein